MGLATFVSRGALSKCARDRVWELWRGRAAPSGELPRRRRALARREALVRSWRHVPAVLRTGLREGAAHHAYLRLAFGARAGDGSDRAHDEREGALADAMASRSLRRTSACAMCSGALVRRVRARPHRGEPRRR